MGRYYNTGAQTESSLQAEIIKLSTNLPNLWVVKVMSCNKRGCPDLICCIKGRFVAIEVKTTALRSQLSDSQRAQLGEIEKSGGVSCVVRSAKEFLDVYKKIIESENDL